MKRSLFFFFTLLFAASCADNDKIPKDVLPREKMQTVLWSLISAGEFLNGFVLNKDSADKTAESLKIYGRVFQVYHITKEQFDKSYVYYREHPELMTEILDSLSKKPAYTVEKFQKAEDSAQKKAVKRPEIK